MPEVKAERHQDYADQNLKNWQRKSAASYGPFQTRRQGWAVGINLLPANGKWCSFDCLYCQLGLNDDLAIEDVVNQLPGPEEVFEDLEERLQSLEDPEQVKTLIISGNGEPTLYPDFATTVPLILSLRDLHLPHARVSVMSDGMHLQDWNVRESLACLDDRLLKLDAGFDETFQKLARPNPKRSLSEVVADIAQLSDVTIQSMFLKGAVCNNSDEEVTAYLDLLDQIQPREVQLYSLDRVPPVKGLQKLEVPELESIKARVLSRGHQAEVYP